MVSKVNLASYICFIYIFLYIFGQVIGNTSLIGASILLGFIAYGFTLKIRDKDYLLWISGLFLFVIIILINDTYPAERLFFNLAFIFMNALLSISFMRRRLNTPLILKLLIFSILVFILYAQTVAVYLKIPVYIYLDNTLKGFSYNYISGLLLLSVSLYFAYYAQQEKQPYFGKGLAILTVILCFLLYGRSGIIFSLCLFLVAYKEYLKPSHGIRFFFFLSIAFLFSFFIIYNSYLILEAVQNSKFKEGLDSPRILMLKDYFSSLNFYTFIFGVDITKIPLIASYNVNPHNSYLNLHAMTGVFGLIFLGVVAVMLFSRFLTNLTLFLYLSIYLGRGVLDTIIFPGVLDFIFLGILLGNTCWRKSNRFIKVD